MNEGWITLEDAYGEDKVLTIGKQRHHLTPTDLVELHAMIENSGAVKPVDDLIVEHSPDHAVLTLHRTGGYSRVYNDSTEEQIQNMVEEMTPLQRKTHIAVLEHVLAALRGPYSINMSSAPNRITLTGNG